MERYGEDEKQKKKGIDTRRKEETRNNRKKGRDMDGSKRGRQRLEGDGKIIRKRRLKLMKEI